MKDFEDILPVVQKPVTYLGNEINVIRKDFSAQQVKFALGYPDLYEIGMSSLGLRVLYGLINSIQGVVCERFFAPGKDLEDILKRTGDPLFTLESSRPLKDFDFVGFSISSELNYTNFLNLLSLARIPLRSEERNHGDPLIICGGSCALNPEVLADFVDMWVIGEAEEVLHEIFSAFREAGEMSRIDILKRMSVISGVYVPRFYEEVSGGGVVPVSAGFPAVIERRYVKDLETSFFPSRWVVPLCEIVHDRVSLEIMRGCPQRCLFCQGGFCWKPVRKRSAVKVLEIAREVYARTGYEEMSLLSFSSSDHPEIERIIGDLTTAFKDKRVALSFPSLRIDSFSFELASKISEVRRTGLTFAPETGESMRPMIGKPIPDTKLIDLASTAKKYFWRQIKLYFILGLPCETMRTMEEMADLIEKISKIISVKSSFTTFIPKPHTPFQWERFPSEDEIDEKKGYFVERFAGNRYVKLSFHPYRMSFVESLLSRGNRKTGRLVERVWRNGSSMENWTENFRFEKWIDAIGQEGFSMDGLLGAAKYPGPLPWSHVSAGFPTETLRDLRNGFYRECEGRKEV